MASSIRRPDTAASVLTLFRQFRVRANEDIAARGGRIILIAAPQGMRVVMIESTPALALPEMPSTMARLVYVISVRLIACHTTVIMGIVVDQPRNLAKSVTME